MTSLLRTLGILFLLAVIALASALLTMRFTEHQAMVTVPSLKGQTLAAARRNAAARHLRFHVADRLFSSTVAANRVLNQSPSPGAAAHPGTRVGVALSLGPQTAAVPSVTGEPDRAAIHKIHQAGFQLGHLAYLPTSRAPSGTVLAQSPQAHAKNIASPRIQLLIATPPTPSTTSGYVMPNLIGEPLAQARRTLARAGLKLARVKKFRLRRHASKTHFRPGSVIAQSPQSGYRIPPHGTVTLTVAK